MAKLTTHVLDTTRGGPAAGMRVALFRDGELLREIVTNADGRAEGPLLEGADVTAATYELHFHVADYFSSREMDCPFLDVVPVRFRMDGGGSYHVPLVCSPWAYSTYRGS